MPLEVGTRLGPYEIVAPLGQGGMGEIYRATDTRLDRTVAIKILSPALADDVQFRERFEREARAISALEHPHICALYDVGEFSGSRIPDPGSRIPDTRAPLRYLVIQYLDGETLEARIAKGPLPLPEALTIAIQIADALSAAHRAGIVHRDLKPGNVMLTKTGAKLLDFGLAKVSAPVVAVSSTMAPTTPTVTAQGAILGTFQYMAPEQIEGLEADARTDIFAFGALLFEMITGKKAFEGKTRASLIGAILKDEPPRVSQVQPVAPPALDRIVATCLAKEPDDRWQTARDLHRELKWVAENPAGAVAPTAVSALPSSPAPSRLRTIAGVAGGLAVGIALTAGAVWLAARYTRQTPHQVRFSIPNMSAQTLLAAGDRNIAISPDGRHIVFRVGGGAGPGTSQLFVRALDQIDSQMLAGVTGTGPFFSPDGHWIGFLDQGQIKKVSITGGPAILICRFNGLSRGATWGPDGTIVFATTLGNAALMSVPAGGGEPRKLTSLESGETAHIFPSFLPGGTAVLFTVVRSSQTVENGEIAVLDLKTGRRKVLIRGGGQAEYVRDGHLLYAVSGTLRAVRFDLDRLEVQSDPVPVVEQVMTTVNGAGHFAVSNDGTLAYVQGRTAAPAAPRSLVWVDRKGRETPIEAPPRAYEMPRISPDGTRVALQVADQENDIWIWDVTRKTLTRLTFDSGADNLPVWTPDNRSIVFNSTRSGVRNLYRQAADGTGAVERLTTSENNQFPFSMTPDGKHLVLGEVAPLTAADVRVLALDGPRQTQPIVQTPFAEYGGQISPDGRWMAYQSNESGAFQIYVRPFPNVDSGRWQVSTSGGTRARWAPRSGRELFYLDGDLTLTAVPVRAEGATFSFGNPAKVFDRKYYSGFNLGAYDVSPDGQRFLMIKEDRATEQAAAPPTNLIVVLNWTEELKARMQAR